MAIVYVGGQTNSRAGATSTLSVNYSLTGGTNTVPQAGDLVIITVTVGSAARNPACAITTPAGFTALGLLNASAATQDTSLDVSWKIMGQVPDTSFTLPSTGNVQDAQAYTVQVFRNISSTPLDVTVVSATGTGTDRPNPASITPSTTGAYVVICGGGGSATGAAFVAPANYTTNFLTKTQADTNDVTVGSGYRAWTSGAEDPAAYTGGENAATDSWCAYTIAIRPAVGFADYSADEGDNNNGFFSAVCGIARRLGLAAVLLTASLSQSISNSHQDELSIAVAYGDTGGNLPDLWAAKSNTPRIQYLYTNDELAISIPSIIGDDDEVGLYATKPIIKLFDIYHTDELASHPLDYGEGVELYTAKPIRSLIVEATQDEIATVAASAVVDEESGYDPFTINPKVWMPVPWQFGSGEGSIWNPLDEDYYYQAIISQQSKPYLLISDLQDEVVGGIAPSFGYGDTTGFVLWSASSNTPRVEYLFADEGFVSQPIAISFDEGIWEAVYPAKAVKWISVFELQDEIGTAATPLSIEDGYWIYPFSVLSSKSLHVYNTQDEIVAQPVPIHIDEIYHWVGYSARPTKLYELGIDLASIDISDSIVPFVPPPIPPIPPPIIHGHGKYRIIPQMDVVDRAKFPQDNVGVSNC